MEGNFFKKKLTCLETKLTTIKPDFLAPKSPYALLYFLETKLLQSFS